MHPDAYTGMAALENSHWWFQGRRRILDELITSLKLPAEARILEVGCGTGGNLAMLSRHGQVTAVEMNAAARLIASGRAPLTPLPGHLPDGLPAFDKAFDLICLFDVLEHVQADADSLRALATKLAPGGRILLTVPAYPWLWSQHDTHHHHCRRYTRRTLRDCISQAGLHASRLSYFNTLLFPLAALARLAGKLFSKPRQQVAVSMPPAIINHLLRRLFACESGWLKTHGLAFGLSLFAVVSTHPEAARGN